MGFFANLFKGTDKGKDLEELARRLGLSTDKLINLRPSYTKFTVPKRSGGVRNILAPDYKLKDIQRRILKKLLSRLHDHPAVTGFKRGSSVVTNAMPHRNQSVVIRLDIKDFFDSTKAEEVEKYFRKIGWNKEVCSLLKNICSYNGSLPQGAPTSPKLSNLLNFKLDARFEKAAQKSGANYTRYADDMTFSFDEDNHEKISYLLYMVKLILEDAGYTLHQKKKMHIRRKHQRQIVTGLVVNKEPNLPRKTRRWLRAVEYNLAKCKTCTLNEKQLQGWRALSSMIKKQSKYI